MIGTALLPELSDCHVIALIHRTAVPGADELVAGDLTAPLLGLDPAAYSNLVRRVDAVVHCAAVTDFSSGPEATHALNEAGTRQIVRLVADADAVLYHVSTAFVARTDLTRSSLGHDSGDASARPEDYLDSKRAGEEVVRTSGIPHVIIRPSVVIGDSRTGEISAFQGMHGMLTGLLRGMLPLVPLPPDSPVDFISQDVVAATIAALVRSGRREGEIWVTASAHAPSTGRVLQLVSETASEVGLDVAVPRTVGPEMVDRLIRPVFIAGLHPRARRRFDDMLAMTALFAGAQPFPSSLGLPGLPPHPGPAGTESALRATVLHLVQARGLGRRLAEQVPA
ncbi:putative ketoreductase [Streptomyces venezuelae]|nr:putative ketoreductase [Streptomyces venezuelae]